MNTRLVSLALGATGMALFLFWFGLGADQAERDATDAAPSESTEVLQTGADPTTEQFAQDTVGAPDTTTADPAETPSADESPPLDADLADRLQPHLEKGCIDISLLQTSNLTPLEREDLRAWLDSEGHFNDQFIGGGGNVPQPFGDYETYDDAGLRAIAESGNAKAHLALSWRLLADEDRETAMYHLRESVYLGYTAPLPLFGLLARADQDTEGLSESERVALERENMIEDQAYLRVYDRLGGPLGEFLIGLPQTQDADTREANPDVPSEADIPEIEARADEIHGEIVNERLSRGTPIAQPDDPPIASAMKMDLRVFLAAMERGLAQCD